MSLLKIPEVARRLNCSPSHVYALIDAGRLRCRQIGTGKQGNHLGFNLRKENKRMNTTCHDCGVQPGQLHARGCDVERCPYCGGQLIFCSCKDPPGCGIPDDDRIPWTGEWPGEAECREFGWYAKRNIGGPGWEPCQPDEPGAHPDLNRLHIEAVWDRERKRWVRK